MYAAEFRKDPRTKHTNKQQEEEEEQRPLGYWKMVYLRSVAARDSNKWKRRLGAISSYTGLPSQTERVLR